MREHIRPHSVMSPKMSSKQRSPAGSLDQTTFDLLRHPAVAQAINRAANMKLLQAIKEGRLQIVDQRMKPTTALSTSTTRPIKYAPRMDLIDDPRSPNFSAIFEIPGLRNSDISVQIQEGHLIVCGERRPPYLQTILSQPSPQDSEAVSKDASEHMEVDSPASQAVRVPVQELRFGTFQRNIPIPKGIKEKDVSASLADGMLTVTWPRLSPAAVSSSLSPPARTIGSASPPTSAVTAGTALQ